MFESLSLYLHIPFCSTRCTYCAFNTYANLEHLIEPFLQALLTEIGIVAENNPYTSVGTIFFGGGTPSLLHPEQLGRVLSQVHQHFAVAEDAEISIETNPNNLSIDYLTRIRAIGINRLSIGMQSANKAELDLFARRHQHDAVAQAVADARAADFDNLNLDVMYGFSHQTLRSWAFTLDQLIALSPEHVSMYALGLEPDTAMSTWVDKGLLPVPDDDLAADMYDLATNVMKQNGYQQYEISNWAKPGYECLHNRQYWLNHPYVGLGPGAHGFAGGVRYATLLSPHRYIKNLQNPTGKYDFPHTPATDTATVVSPKDEIAETLMMSMRLTQEGVDRAAFYQRFGVEIMELHGTVLKQFAQRGLVDISAERICLTEQGRLLSNMVLRELI